MNQFYHPVVEYNVPENVGKTSDIVGIDEFILHYALWTNAYSTELHACGIRYDPEVKTLKIPYGPNYNIQIFNPVAGFWQAVTYIGLLALFEEKFAEGKVEEVTGTIGRERVSYFGISVTDADIARAFGFHSTATNNTKKIIDDINMLSRMSAFYCVKCLPEDVGTSMEGKRYTKIGNLVSNRNLRFVHDYIRREKNGRGHNTLILDKDMVEACHDKNFVVNHRRLFELRSKLKSKTQVHQLILGLYLYLLGNKPVENSASRFHLASDLDKYFQIVAPKKPLNCTETNMGILEAQGKIYQEVHTMFRRDLRTALIKMKEMKLITGWKASMGDNKKKDSRSKTDYINLAKVHGILVWM